MCVILSHPHYSTQDYKKTGELKKYHRLEEKTNSRSGKILGEAIIQGNPMKGNFKS